MTLSEFENLKFGDKVYNKHDEEVIHIKVYENCIEYINERGFIYLEEYNLCSLTPPKKKVKKTVVMFTDTAGIRFINIGHDLNINIWSFRRSNFSDIPITITYETEE